MIEMDLELAKGVSEEAAKDIFEITEKLKKNDDNFKAFLLEGWRSASKDKQDTVEKLIKAIKILAIIIIVQFLVMVGSVIFFWNNIEIADSVKMSIEWEMNDGDVEVKDNQQINPTD